MSKKQQKEEAKRLVTEFKTAEMAKKAIAEIQRVLVYYSKTDNYGLNWMEYFKGVAAEIEKL